MMTDLLVFHQVYYAYGAVPAVVDVSLHIAGGERIALIGPNGSGKTTLARLSNGLLRPQRGRILVAGMETTSCPPGELARKVGYVFQNPDHQLFRPTVEQELAFGPQVLGLPQSVVTERVEIALQAFALEPYRRRHPALLGRGLRQLTAIAAVYALDPAVLILDEALSALDPPIVARVLSLLERECQHGRSVILVTHDLRLAAWAERVILLHGGRIVADNSAPDVLGDPELLAQAGLQPLPVTQLATRLFGRRGVLTVDELVALLHAAWRPLPSRRNNSNGTG